VTRSLGKVVAAAAGAACLALGLGVGAQSIVLRLNPTIARPLLPEAVSGALLLKGLFLADGCLLLGLADCFRTRQSVSEPTRFEPLWRPPEKRHSTDLPLNQFHGILLGLLIAAAAVRIIGLNSDLWMDEVFTLVRTVRPPAGRLLTVFVDDNQHTLYSLLAKGCVALLGESPAGLRLPAVALGVAGVWAAARVAALAFGRREALLTGFLLAFSYHPVWFSQDARGYTILLFAATVSTELLLRGLMSGKWSCWLAYSAIIAAGAMGHLSAVFLAMGQALVVMVVLLRARRLTSDGSRPAVAFGLAAWLTIHAYALVIPQMYAFFSQPGAGSAAGAEWTRPLWMVRETLSQLGPFVQLGWAGLAVGGLIAGYAVVWLARRDWIVLLFTVAPAIVAGGVLFALGRSLWPRSFFHLLGLAAVLIAAVAIALGDRIAASRKSQILRLAPAALLCLVSALSLPAVYRHPKQDFTGARDFIRANLGPADAVAALHMAGRVYNLYYAPEWGETNTIEELEAARSRHGRTWVVYTLPGYLETRRPELTSVLRKDYRLVRIFSGTLGDGDLFVLCSKRLE
jgi:hypothetical protein